MSDNLKNTIRIIESLTGDVELVSYGLAPKPNGFCYENHGNINETDLKVLDTALGSLNNEETETLRELYL